MRRILLTAVLISSMAVFAGPRIAAIDCAALVEMRFANG
jgi:hypothetical protein